MTVKRFDAGSWRDSPLSRRRLDLSQFAEERKVVADICARVASEGDQALRELDGTENKGRLGANAILGVSLAALEMQQPALARAVPSGIGVVVLIAGLLQFTAWKARHLACCREVPAVPARGRMLPPNAGTAWRHGLRLGLHCSYCCAGLVAILLVIGVMDLRAMAVVAAAITVERLAPAGERVARAIGAVVVGAGLILIARAVGLG